MIINLWPFDDVGDIWPMRSKAHHENGHIDCIGCNTCEGWIKGEHVVDSWYIF